MADSLYKYFTRFDEVASTSRFWKAIEAYTNFFKTYATMRPDFHVRNAMSAMFMNSSDGVPVNFNFRALAAWKRFSQDSDGFIKKLRANPDAMSDFVGLRNGQLADAFDAALGSGAGGQFAERGVSDSHRRLVNNPATRLSKKAGEYVEGPVRLAVAMDSIKKGQDKYQALTRITRLHFDYSEVSKLDQMAKRFIPFWTFMSRNLPLQLTQMLSKPRWYAWYNSFVRNFSAEGDPLSPAYWSENEGFALPEAISAPIRNLPIPGLNGTSDQIWLTPDLQHNRINADVNDWVSTLSGKDAAALTNFNPLFTAPLEIMMSKDMFTGREYGTDDVQKLGGVEKALDPILSLLGISENGYAEDKYLNAGRAVVPTWDQLIRLFPGIMTGAQSDMDMERRGETYLRRVGAPIRQLTPAQRQATARTNYYNQQDEARRQQAISGG